MTALSPIKLRLIDRVIRQVITFAVSIIIIRFLQPEAYSEYVLILASVTIFAFLSNLGMVDLLQFKFINRIDRLKNLTIAIRLRIITVSFAVLLIAVYFWIVHRPSLLLALIYCATLYWQSLDIFEQYYLSRLGYEKIIYQRLAIIIAFMLLKLTAAYQDNLYLLIGLIFFEQMMIGLLYLSKYKFNYLFIKIQRDQYFEFVMHIKSMFFANLLQGLRQRLDILILSGLISSYALASYSANTRIVEGILVLGSLFLNTMNIEILKNFKGSNHKKKSQVTIYRCIFYGTLVFILPIIYYSKDILNFLFDGKYADGYQIMQITLAGLPFAMLGYLSQLHFIARGSSNDILRVSIAGTLMSLMLLVTFSLIWNSTGAAFSILLGSIIQCFLVNFIATDKSVFQLQKKAIFFI